MYFDFNTESPEEVQPGKAPPTDKSTVHTESSDSQSQSTEETTTGLSDIPIDDDDTGEH